MAEKEDFESSSSNLAESTDVTDGPARRGLARVIHNGMSSIFFSSNPIITVFSRSSSEYKRLKETLHLVLLCYGTLHVFQGPYGVEDPCFRECGV